MLAPVGILADTPFLALGAGFLIAALIGAVLIWWDFHVILSKAPNHFKPLLRTRAGWLFCGITGSIPGVVFLAFQMNLVDGDVGVRFKPGSSWWQQAILSGLGIMSIIRSRALKIGDGDGELSPDKIYVMARTSTLTRLGDARFHAKTNFLANNDRMITEKGAVEYIYNFIKKAADYDPAAKASVQMLTNLLERSREPVSDFDLRDPDWRTYVGNVLDISYDIIGERRLKTCLKAYKGEKSIR